jgi:tetratricopeptide (TPR) repeat protein
VRGYTTREVSEILELPASRIRDWTRRGLLEPERGSRGAYLFSFQDVVLLRAARELLEQRVSTRRVRAALEALREQLPEGRPLSGVRIAASGDRVVVHDADAVWEPTSGQLTLDFSVSEVVTRARPIVSRGLDRPGAPSSPTADDWYDTGLDLEAVSAAEAMAAYRRAMEIEPAHAESHLNLGRLLHEAGETSGALDHYRCAADASPTDARAPFNAGVALEDLGRSREAIDAYRAAIELDPAFAPAHFNLSRLLESEGREAEALEHLVAYKRLRDAGAG